MAAEVLSSSLRNPNLDNDLAIDENGCQQTADTWKKEQPQQVGGSNQQKKGHRRKPSKKKRKWKPYNKLSWQERKALDEKEKYKAVRIREEMKEKGRPVAPYNTTQYLMAEHDPHEGGFEPAGLSGSNMTTMGTDDGESYSDEQEEQIEDMQTKDDGSGVEEQFTAYTDSPHMVSEFISQDFSETYERVHEESLEVLTREELLQEHMELEYKFNQLQEQLSMTKRSLLEKANTLEARVQILHNEKEQLKCDIERLSAENKSLREEKSEPLPRIKVERSDGIDVKL